MSKMKPNFTQTPNIIFDELLCDLEKGELKVLFYVVRRTFGFQKNKDRISFSQMQNGIKDKEGKILDRGTKLGKETLTRSIASLEALGILIVDRTKGTNSYSLNLDYDTSTIIELVPRSNRTSTTIEPKLVPQSNIQKKEKESTQKKDSEETSQPFILEKYIVNMEENSRRDINIIALYLRERINSLKSKIVSKDQLDLFIRRHLRAAKPLKIYTDKQLIDGIKEVKKEHGDIQWTLETLLKILTK